MGITRGSQPAGATGAAGAAGASGALVLITDTLLGADAASFDFTSISGSYKHLKLICDLRSARVSGSDFADLKLNNDAGTNYDGENVVVSGASVTAEENLASPGIILERIPANTAPAGASAALEILIPNYASTTFHKNVLFSLFNPMDTSTGTVRFYSGGYTWKNTAAVNQVTLFPDTGPNWLAGSRASLYGIN